VAGSAPFNSEAAAVGIDGTTRAVGIVDRVRREGRTVAAVGLLVEVKRCGDLESTPVCQSESIPFGLAGDRSDLCPRSAARHPSRVRWVDANRVDQRRRLSIHAGPCARASVGSGHPLRV